jgi:zinc protease
VARWFGALPRPARKLPATYTAEPAQDGERAVTLRRVGDVQMAGTVYHVPAGSHPDFAAVDLLAFILGDTPSGRLHKALVETKKAAAVWGSAWQLHDPGVLVLGAEVRADGNLAEARDLLVRVTEELAQQPPSEQEVARARDSRLKDWETTLRNSEWAAIELSEWAAMGDWRLMFLHRDRIKAVTPADVVRVARAYIKPENRTVGLYFPTREPARAEIPPRPDVAALVRDYKGGEALQLGEAFDRGDRGAGHSRHDPAGDQAGPGAQEDAGRDGQRVHDLAPRRRGEPAGPRDRGRGRVADADARDAAPHARGDPGRA